MLKRHLLNSSVTIYLPTSKMYKRAGLGRERDRATSPCQELTHSRNNLCLHPKLILKSTRKIRDAAATVPGYIRHFPNVVEHVARGEEEDGDEAERGPEVAVLHDGQYVRPCDGAEGDETQRDSCADEDAGVVERSHEGWVLGVGEVAGDPGVDWTGVGGSGDRRREISS